MIGNWDPFIFGVLLSNTKQNIQQGFAGSAKAKGLQGNQGGRFKAGLLDPKERLM
jgi:hypothetical protein